MSTLTIIGAIFVGLLLLIIRQDRALKRKEIAKICGDIATEYGKLPFPMKVRQDTYPDMDRIQKSALWIDQITWNDLEMETILKRIDYTRCSAGHRVLYEILRNPTTDKQILRQREQIIDALSENKEVRERLAYWLTKIGDTGTIGLREHLAQLEQMKPAGVGKHIGMDLLYLPGIVLLFFQPLWGLIGLFFVLLINTADYFKEKGKMLPHLRSFAYILRMVKYAEKIGTENLSSLEVCQRQLKEAESRLRRFGRFSGLAFSMQNPIGNSNPLAIIMEYLNMMFHFNLMKLASMFRIVKEQRSTIEELENTIGLLDACMSIAYFRASLEKYCEPHFVEKRIECKGVYHPLIDRPVANDLRMDRNILLTGSNASGKSTFLKTLGINVVFAQTIVTCTAHFFAMPRMRILTSMSLRDNLLAGDSYFMVEIKAMKRILEASKETDFPLFCMVDEVLRGTNTIERIAASTEILKSLATEGTLCVAATHDIELTELLKNCYDNYHFEEALLEGDVMFSYQLKEGRAMSCNAIELLKGIGYEEQIVAAARERAKILQEERRQI